MTSRPDGFAAVRRLPPSVNAAGPEWDRHAIAFTAEEAPEWRHLEREGYNLVPLYAEPRPAAELGTLLSAVASGAVSPAPAAATLAEHLAAVARVCTVLAGTAERGTDADRIASAAAADAADIAARLGVLASVLAADRLCARCGSAAISEVRWADGLHHGTEVLCGSCWDACAAAAHAVSVGLARGCDRCGQQS